ncbi:MAG: hypothetical protein ACD_76C00078G0007 [uncultured bacterium]|nr:MAG: hypothetical protein ACD_76C00078G0007 [uncultured bacterium]HBD05002.1 hypothetical protein [Candidatus Uhrbacteria bacterium]
MDSAKTSTVAVFGDMDNLMNFSCFGGDDRLKAGYLNTGRRNRPPFGRTLRILKSLNEAIESRYQRRIKLMFVDSADLCEDAGYGQVREEIAAMGFSIIDCPKLRGSKFCSKPKDIVDETIAAWAQMLVSQMNITEIVFVTEDRHYIPIINMLKNAYGCKVKLVLMRAIWLPKIADAVGEDNVIFIDPPDVTMNFYSDLLFSRTIQETIRRAQIIVEHHGSDRKEQLSFHHNAIMAVRSMIMEMRLADGSAMQLSAIAAKLVKDKTVSWDEKTARMFLAMLEPIEVLVAVQNSGQPRPDTGARENKYRITDREGPFTGFCMRKKTDAFLLQGNGQVREALLITESSAENSAEEQGCAVISTESPHAESAPAKTASPFATDDEPQENLAPMPELPDSVPALEHLAWYERAVLSCATDEKLNAAVSKQALEADGKWRLHAYIVRMLWILARDLNENQLGNELGTIINRLDECDAVPGWDAGQMQSVIEAMLGNNAVSAISVSSRRGRTTQYRLVQKHPLVARVMRELEQARTQE